MKISEQTVRAALDPIVGGETLSPWDKQRIVRTAEMFSRRPPVRWPKRLATAAVTAVLTLVCATGVLAATGLSDQLGMLSRQTLAFLKPVNEQCEDAGLRVEVIAAMNDGDTAIAYIGLEDLTGQNRLDATTQAPDCNLEDPAWFAQVDNVYYKDDGSVVLRVVGQDGRSEISGSKVTLSLDNVLSGGQCSYGVDTGYTVADVLAQNANPLLNVGAQIDSYTLMAGMDSRLYRQLESGSFQTLKVMDGVRLVDDRASWATLRSAGVVDGVLHILIEPDADHWYNTLNFSLADENGELLDVASGVVYLGQRYKVGRVPMAEYSQYQEHLLELPQGYDPEQLHILCDISTYDTCISGRWDVTFTLQENENVITASCDMDMQPWRLTRVELSPVGVSMTGSGSMLENSLMPDVELRLTNGQWIRDFSGSTGMYSLDEDGSEIILLKYLFDEPLDPETVAEIRINGVSVWAR